MVALVLSLGVANAFAAAGDPTYSITVSNDNKAMSIAGKTYTAYKLFDLTYSGDNYAYSIKTDNPFYSTAAAKAVLDTYFDFTDTSDPNVKTVTVKTEKQNATTKTLTASDVRALADALQPYATGTGDGSATATSESVTIDLPVAGYYIVTGTVKPNDPANSTKEVVSAVILDNVDPNAAVKPKATVPPFDKKMTAVDGSNTNLLDSTGKEAVAKVGSIVSYQLDSLVPDLTGYDDYTFTFHDTLTAGLDYVPGSFVVTINEQTETITPTIADDGKSFTLTIPFLTLGKYTKGDAIVVTYNCKVNSQALTYDFENNTANLEYSNNPYDETTNHTPDKKTYVIDINLDVSKTNNEGAPLAEAEFKLFRLATDGETREFYKWDAAANDNKGAVTWVADTQSAPADVFATDSTGKLTTKIQGLDKGTYYLLETKAPTGYNLLKDPVEVIISVEKGTGDNAGKVIYSATYAGQAATMTNGTVDLTEETHSAKQPVATGTIINQSGAMLPSTGGIGTTIFYVVGGVLVLAAIILLVTKKRMSE